MFAAFSVKRDEVSLALCIWREGSVNLRRDQTIGGPVPSLP
jgi:hypothetical protein